ncbi:MAG: uracil phosphoribosyltransferase [Flavobacteriaceae bacterium]|nr:uracil phosphoribosyltransferase [Flavobacteriaceae bacterium]
MNSANLEITNSILNNFISEVRNLNTQKDAMRFRRNIERIGEILSYELSKELSYSYKNIISPLGVKKIPISQKNLVLCSILRAGLPLHQGILNYFDNIESAFISAYRKQTSHTDFEITVEYLASPSLDQKVLILADPMLATSNSLVAVHDTLKKLGDIKQIHIVSVIAATKGIEYIKQFFPKSTHLWVATIDKKLDKNGYIVPGLGDAGDLAFGKKL